MQMIESRRLFFIEPKGHHNLLREVTNRQTDQPSLAVSMPASTLFPSIVYRVDDFVVQRWPSTR